ncbi:BUD4 [[Candida] subhashii]|uniref:BUD4 n=1 Tax=[Candida] subhashii TaxID=561895 RepID=A0A8J5QDM2_9ASCO|nr:BUD4 [[Candida] subhashii]KAG7664184.1 BUD4 [[Candida] subhashii]
MSATVRIIIDESQGLIERVSPSATHQDLFKHENESVDLLLKEMNLDPNLIATDDTSSIFNSPTKPLNFPRVNSKPILSTKENSSSDTYASDDEQQQQQQANQDQCKNSFDRNFDFDHSIEVQKTIANNDSDEFLFHTPKTSTVNLLEKTKSNNSSHDIYSQSPSKSIMKKSNSQSPSKSVAFMNSSPQIHQYTDDSETSNIDQEVQQQEPINNEWNQVEQQEGESSDNSIPPTPPPHKSNTYAELLNDQQVNDKLTQIPDLKLKQNDFNKLSLDEKLDLYLSKQDTSINSDVESKAYNSDMDNHLNQLEEAAKFKTNDNIADLSLSIQIPQSDNIENPLDSLAQVKLLSHSGSSQSSLQSLRDDNRKLESTREQPTSNAGLALNDGIKGLSDDLVESLLPVPHPTEVITNSPSFGISEQDDDSSFDKSYNHTEQSIMDLLNTGGSSCRSLANDGIEVEEPIETDLQESENISETTEKVEGPVQIKQEEEETIPIQVKQEMEPMVKQEPTDIEIKQESRAHVSEFNGLTPQQEIEQILAQKKSQQVEESDESTISQESTKMSIRFHMDSDWKLEDSHDGDREDNDESQMDITGGSIKSSVLELDEIKTLEPPRINQAIEVTNSPTGDISTNETDALANSSNIAPPEEITLPIVQPTTQTSLIDEMVKSIQNGVNAKSYEDLFSAENDEEKPPVDFISIWHTQERKKRHTSLRLTQSAEELKTITNNAPVVNTNDNAYISNRIKLPSYMKPTKKFKEVNVMSRRVVSPGYEDLSNVSHFLPELSDDSGFENMNFYATNIGTRSQDFLTNIDNDPNILEPPPQQPSQPLIKTNRAIRTAQKLAASQSLNPTSITPPTTLKPRPPPISTTNPFRSRFRVPTFEIKRTGSILSPKDQYYQELYSDISGIGAPSPTIKAPGMKTLPSMDRDDVKKILSTKRVITQEEYTKVKLVNQPLEQRNSIVEEPPVGKFENISRVASIYEMNDDTRADEEEEGDGEMPYFVDELKKSPIPLLSQEQLFPERRVDSVVVHKKEEMTPSPVVSEFDSDVTIAAKRNNPFRVTKINTPEIVQEANTSRSISPTKKAPIKIGTPVKLKKHNGFVTGIELEKTFSRTGSDFNGDELINGKLRNNQSKVNQANDSLVAAPPAPHQPSAISDNSGVTAVTETEPNVDLTKIASTEPRSAPPPPPLERGRLFFRLVGVKNINLPDLTSTQINATFSIILDNGVHCIQTPEYGLNSTQVSIGKEFELIVGGSSLEFIITMKSNYEPKPRTKLVEVTEQKLLKPKKRLSRLFGTKELVTTTKVVPQEVRDPWRNKFAPDGSFARCYIDLSQYEPKITGRAQYFDLNCFNEWETSVDSKYPDKTFKVKPYRIAQLEVEMLFIPRTERMEVLPMSIKTAYESVNELKVELNTEYEGFLYQEGGDCEIWKRRWFRLQNGTELIAHSEYSRKTRAKINLNKIVDVIYVDKENMNDGGSKKNYRDFSDVLLLDHAFKIVFANGEIIDFGAPNKEEKRNWVEILESIVYRNYFRRQPWVQLMVEANGVKKSMV